MTGRLSKLRYFLAAMVLGTDKDAIQMMYIEISLLVAIHELDGVGSRR